MKNFKANYMEENGTAKKTLSRKEYDEQMKLKFAAMEDEKHEQLSEKAKEEFANKSDEEKQKTMNEIIGEDNVEKKPLTYELMKAVEERRDLTFYVVSSTGLNTADKQKVIKGADGKAEKITIAKDEPTLFKAESYTFDKEKDAYVPKESAAWFIEASQDVVQRALDNADKYDVFANADFDKDAYLSGKDVMSKEDAKAKIAEFFEKQEGLTIAYGAFHDNVLRGNDFPIPKESLDLNRVMVEQGKYGTASLGGCVNQIIGAQNENKLALASSTEKLIADIVCVMKLASEKEKDVKFLIDEKNVDKFSDKDRETLFAADEKLRPEIMPRPRRERTPEQNERLQRRLRNGRTEADREESGMPRGFVRREPRREEAEPARGFVRRQPKIEENIETKEAPAHRGFVRREPPKTAEVKSEEKETVKKDVVLPSEPVNKERPVAKQVVSADTASLRDIQDDLNDFFSDQDEKNKDTKEEFVKQQADQSNEQQKTVLEKQQIEFVKQQADQSNERQKAVLEKQQIEAQKAEVQRAAQQKAEEQEVLEEKRTEEERRVAEEQQKDPITAVMEGVSMAALVKAVMEQNKLLQERNELSMKSNEIEEQKIAEMQKQSELMEQQALYMKKLTTLMDNLTKLYSIKDVEQLRVEPDRPKETEIPERRRMPSRRVVAEDRDAQTGVRGKLDQVFKGVENPEAEDMNVEAPKPNLRGRIKDDDDIGKP